MNEHPSTNDEHRDLGLHGRLATLADRAPVELPSSDLWSRGKQRQRRRRIGAVVAAVVVLLGSGGLVGLLHDTKGTPSPAHVPFGDLHIPRTVHAPSPWAKSTAQTGAPGRLAAISLANRTTRRGLTGKHTALAAFGISAATGRSVFLGLKGTTASDLGNGGMALSPDGTKVGYYRFSHGKIRGWAVYDTVTGRTRMLTDPDNPVIHGALGAELAFSGDSRYLETNYSRSGSDGDRAHDFVVWDVDTGKPTTIEKAGHYYFPELGSGPSGVVWSRGRSIHITDPAAGDTATPPKAPYEVIQAAYGPDGRATLLITFGPTEKAPWRVYADGRRVAGAKNPDSVIGWADADHAVVRSMPSRVVRYVDVRNGKVTDTVRLHGPAAMAPSYAADLWANSLVAGSASPRVDDPRPDLVWYGVGAAGGLVVLAGAGLVVMRRRRG